MRENCQRAPELKRHALNRQLGRKVKTKKVINALCQLKFNHKYVVV